MSEEFTQSSGNVFTDLGFPPEEAEEFLIRSDLMIAITQYIEEQGWTQVQAAEQFKVAEPRISEMLHGRIELFSVDKLTRMFSQIR